MEGIKDSLGQQLFVGDYIAYGSRKGDSAKISLYKIL